MRMKAFKNKFPIYTDRCKIQILGSRDVDRYILEIRKPYFLEYSDNHGIEKLTDFEVARRLRSLVDYYGSSEKIQYEIRLVVKDKMSGELFGGITFLPVDADGFVPIGYWVVPEHQGKGIATETLTRITEFAEKAFKRNKGLRLIIQERNEKSLNVASKCGFELEKVYRGKTGRNQVWVRKFSQRI